MSIRRKIPLVVAVGYQTKRKGMLASIDIVQNLYSIISLSPSTTEGLLF